MRWWTWLATAAVLVTASAGAEPKGPRAAGKHAKPPADPYTQGVREAEAEWRNGAVTLYRYGNRREAIDEKHGIPYHYFGGGCFVVSGAVERTAGHNDRVQQLLRERGLAPGNKRAWLPELLAPVKYWQSVQRAPAVLRPDGREVVSPDGTVRVRLQPGPPERNPQLLVTRNGAQFAVTVSLGEGEQARIEVQWGPEKSDLLFVRQPGVSWGGDVLQAYDARTGRLFNVVFAPPTPEQP